MNNMWKRVMNLALSGVLLMSCVPVQVWAEEEPTTPAVVRQPESGTYPVMPVDWEEKSVHVNGEIVANDSEKISYIDGILTLKDAVDIETIEVTGVSLTIVLEGKNEIHAGSNIAITTDRNLTITGEGSLKITTSNAVAVQIAGSEADKNVLTINGAQVLVEVTPEENVSEGAENTESSEPAGIACEGGVVIEGAAHFRTSHSRNTDKYVMECDGYYNSEVYTKKTEINGGDALEFIGKDHMGEWVESNNESREHYKCCEDSKCILMGKVRKHKASEESAYKEISTTQHQQVYVCCDMALKGISPEDHKLEYTAEGASITAKCSDCEASETFTLTAKNLEVGSETEAVTFTAPTGVLSGKITQDMIVYTDADGSTLEEVPTAIGDYTASVTLEEENVRAAVAFSINKLDFSKAEITLAGEKYVYNGEAHKPEVVAVELNGKSIEITADQIAYSNNIAVGEATVTVTMPADSEYVNAAVATFTIEAKTITENDVKLGNLLTYNGQKQTQTVVPAVENSGVTFDVEGNEATNAGTYLLVVKGKGNYTGEVKLSYSVAKSGDYKDATVLNQNVGKGVGDLQLPAFTGISGEKVEGSCKYTVLYNNETVEIAQSAIRDKINQMEAGTTVKLHYAFTPADNSNYTGSKSNDIEITKVDLTFELENGESVTADKVKKTGPIQYGDTDMINTALIAKVNGKPNENEQDKETEIFTVQYAKVVNGNPVETTSDTAVVGSNKFYLYYSGTNGGYTFENILVCEGWLDVSPRTITEADVVKPVAVILAENADGSPLALLTDENRGKIGTDPTALEYRLANSTTYGTYSPEVPKVTEGGCYEVYYRPSANYTPRAEGKLQILVLPYLTATYGQTFEDIQNQLPEGFAFNKTAHPNLDVEVGNAGDAKIKLDYSHPNDNPEVADDYPTLTGHEVTLKISPKEVMPTVALNTDVYDKNKDGYIPFGNITKNDLFVVKVGEEVLVYGTDYTVKKEAAKDGLTGVHTIACKDGRNYIFGPVKSDPVKLYKADHDALKKENFPEDVLEATEYQTVEKVKTALRDKLEEDTYPIEYMKFFKVYLMKQVGASVNDNQWVEHMAEGMFPTAGLTYEIPYSGLRNATEKDEFKVAVLYLSGDHAGKIVELEEQRDFDTSSTGLKINLKREAIVCIAKEVDLTEEFDIAKSIVLDSKTSKKGTLTIKVGDKVATKATYGTTVKVCASASSGYSVEKVTVTDAGGNAVALNKKSEGNYEFKMPASKVTVKLSLKKTTSATKNPSSGDTSNIYLWVAILGASGVAIAMLMAFWFRKRRK